MSTEQAYINGFVKRAMEYGYTEAQGVELLKEAEGNSSWLGRMLAMDAIRSEANMASPISTSAIGAPGIVLSQMTHLPINVAGPLISRNALGPEEGREERIKELAGNRAGKGYGESALYGAKQLALPGALAGALGAAGAMAIQPGDTKINDLLENLGYGGLFGSATAAGVGGIGAILNKAILNNTSDETRDRAAKRLAKHPYSVGLPLGSAVHAAFA